MCTYIIGVSLPGGVEEYKGVDENDKMYTKASIYKSNILPHCCSTTN